MTKSESVNPYKKYTKDTFLATIANIAMSLKGIILLPILTKTLDAELYGIWSLILVTIALLTPLALLQLNQAMTRFLAAEEDKKKISKGVSSIFIAVFLIGAALSLVIFAGAKPLAVTLFGGANAEPFIKIAAFVLFITVIDQIVSQYFRAFRQMKRYSFFMILQTVGEVSLIAYFVSAGLGLFGALYSLLAVRALTFTIGFLLVTSEIKITTPQISLLRPYLFFSLPLIPFMLCAWIVTLSDRYVIGYFMSIDAVGVYSACYALGSMAQFFISPLWIVLFPATTNLYEKNQIPELKNHLKYSLKFFLMFAIPASFGLSVLSKSLLGVLTTPKFIEGYLIVPIVAVGVVLFSSSTIMGNILMLVKRTKTLSLIYGISALINIMLNIILVPLIGILGAAIATLMTFMVHLVVIGKISFKELSFDVDPKFIIKSLISSSIMGLIILRLNPISISAILISITAGAVMYFGILILLKGFTKEEYMFIRDTIKL
jgi:O-antigen/teichoic acid export membrane protein